MNKVIEKFDDRGNLVYYKSPNDNNVWREYDKNNNLIHYKHSNGWEDWYKWENNKPISITEQEYKYIEFRIKEKEYNSRTKCSRFELMDI